MEPAILDAERQEKARLYARLRRRLMLVDLLLGAAYTLAWLVSGAALALESAVRALSPNPWWMVAAFGLVFGGIYYLLDLPLAYYTGYTLPHRFGLSTQTLRGWLADQLKGLLVGGSLGLVLLETVYALLRAFPESWWLWAGVILLLFTVLLANLAPVLLLPLFFRTAPLGAERADLVERLTRLAEKAGTRVRGVYEIDLSRRTKAANAALAGLGNTRRILLADTLLDEFTDDEIETVLAHELGHHVHGDIPLGILVESLMTLGGLYLAHLGLREGAGVLGYRQVWEVAAMPYFALAMGAYGLVVLPLGNAFSRWRERRADEYALRATGKGQAYASALARLANQNLAEADPEPWVEFLLYSHPALGRRIAMAEASKEG